MKMTYKKICFCGREYEKTFLFGPLKSNEQQAKTGTKTKCSNYGTKSIYTEHKSHKC